MRRHYAILASMIVVALLVGSIGCSTRPAEATPAEFFKSHDATLVVSWAAGGGTDWFNRLLANYWPDVFGSKAKVVNMEGGAGLVGTNFVAKSKADGLTLQGGGFGSHLGGAAVFQLPGMEFDVSKLSYIGGRTSEPYVVLLSTKLPYNSVEDLRKAKGIKFIAFNKMSTLTQQAALFLYLLGGEGGQVITGYASAPEVGLAIAKGEGDATVLPFGSAQIEMDKGYVKPIVVLEYAKSELLPKTPRFLDVFKLTPEQQKLLQFFTDVFSETFVVYGPAGIPEDRLQFLRDGYKKMVELPGYKEQTIKRTRVLYPNVTGEEVERMARAVGAMDQAMVATVKEIGNRYIK